MSSPSQQFFKLIQQGHSHLVKLCELCEQEREAIEARSVEQLQQAVQDKHQQLELIATNISSRNQILSDQGFNPDNEGLDNFFLSLPKDQYTVLNKAWKKLTEQLKQVSELNQRNEKIVLRSQKNMEQLLSILQGHSAKTTLYNESGDKGNYSAQNTLGKA